MPTFQAQMYDENQTLLSVPYYIRLSSSFNEKINTQYSKNLAFSPRQFFYLPYSTFQNDAFFLNFLISPHNSN